MDSSSVNKWCCRLCDENADFYGRVCPVRLRLGSSSALAERNRRGPGKSVPETETRCEDPAVAAQRTRDTGLPRHWLRVEWKNKSGSRPVRADSSILANRPGISGTVPETDLLSCCPGNNQNCPGNYTHGLGVYYVQASCLTNYYVQMSASTSGSARLEPVSKKAM